MAKQIDDVKVTLGKKIRVANQDQKSNENEIYVAIQVEDESGDNERCLLFTESELNAIETVKFNFAYENMKPGRLYSANLDKKDTYLVKLDDNSNNSLYRVSPSQLKAAEERAKRNPEDLTKKGFITNLLD